MDFQPNTKIMLCNTDLILGNGYQIAFNTEQQQHDYFVSKTKYTFDEQTYTRYGVGRVSLEIEADTILGGVNYLMFQNTNYSNKWFYANILRIHYINENTTHIDYAIDSYQTFMFEINMMNPSYIDRRHYAFFSDGFDKIMSLPYEDLDIGDSYVTLDTGRYDLTNLSDTPTTDISESTKEATKASYLIITSTESLFKDSLEGRYGVNNNGLTSFPIEGGTKTYWLANATGGMLFYTIMNYNAFSQCLNSGSFTSVQLNGKIMSIQLLPFGEKVLDLYGKFETSTNMIDKIYNISGVNKTTMFASSNVGAFTASYKTLYFGTGTNPHLLLDKYLNATSQGVPIESIEEDVFTTLISTSLNTYLYRYPYSLFEVSDNGSNIITYKPQNFLNGNVKDFLSRRGLSFYSFISNKPAVTMAWQLAGYQNVPNYGNIMRNFTGAQWETSFFGNFNFLNSAYSTPVINDYTSAFLQANQNQISAQRTNASRALNTTLTNANASMQAQANANYLNYQNAGISADTSIANSNINASMGLANAGLGYNNAQLSATNSLVQGGSNAIGNIMGGNIGQGLGNAFGAGANYATAGMIAGNNMQMAQNSIGAMQSTTMNSANAMMLQAGNSLQASAGIMNANYANTKRNASLAYQTTISMLNARLQDIQNVPDSVQGTVGTDIPQILMNKNALFIKTKSLPANVLKRVSNYLLLYGFKSNSFEKVQQVINNWQVGGYVKTVNSNIVGNVPMDNLQEIIQMFDNGIFIWKGIENLWNWEGVKNQ